VEAAGYAQATPLSLDTSDSNVYSQQATISGLKQSFSATITKSHPGTLPPQEHTARGTRRKFFRHFEDPARAVVNQLFAQRLFHSDDVVGRYFKNSSGQPIQIVGIVAMENTFRSPKIRKKQRSSHLAATNYENIAPRSGMPPDSSDEATKEMAATIRKVVRDLDTAIPVRESSPGRTSLD